MTTEEKFIRRTFELAQQGVGAVSPNPLVGAIVIRNGKILGEGFHRKYGGDHAEIDALKNCSESTDGATLYCNLEPCSHTKKQTPPCVPTIIKSGIRKVIISNIDPNPAVSGNGVRLLRSAGIEVVTSVLENDGLELNKIFFKYIKTNLPYVILKCAQSKDGLIAEHNRQVWLTGEESGKYVHKLRSIYDSILIGANTLRIDNPRLSVRQVSGNNPKVIILTKSGMIQSNASVFNSEVQKIVFCESDVHQHLTEIFSENPNVDVLKIECGEGSIRSILQKLGAMKITSVMVEGGRQIFEQFIKYEIPDEIHLLIAPTNIGNGVIGITSKELNKYKLKSTSNLGSDKLKIFTQ